MIYANAETGQDIARLLRSAKEPIQITAPRRCGKTTELLKFAEEKNPLGQFAIVCQNSERQRYIIGLHWKIFNRISQADIVTKRLLGEPMGGVDINPPLVVTSQNIYLLRGSCRPIYVDDWTEINSTAQADIVESRYFVAGVTS
jgi:hypothetical protein